MYRPLLLLALAFFPGLVINPSFVIDWLLPVTYDSLDVPQSVDFGELHPAQRRTLELPVRNLTCRPIQLQQPRVDCGCLLVDDLPPQLAAYESALARVSITAPAKGGPFSRNLLLLPKGADGPAWTIRATGTVTARVWSEPSQVNIDGDHPSEEIDIKLCSAQGARIDRVVASSSQIDVLDSTKRDGELRIRVRLNAHGDNVPLAGKESVDVFLDGQLNQPSLRVPIRWSPIPKIGFVPNNIDLPSFGKESDAKRTLRRVLAIVVPPDRSASEAQIEVLVPWARIAKKSIIGSTVRLDLEFSTDSMPSEFTQAVLATHFPGESIPEKLIAIGRRG